MFYVINLLRRSDRKTEFLKKIEETGLSLDDVEVRIAATVQSHYNVWKKIANNPDSDFGVVMEDDIFFPYLN